MSRFFYLFYIGPDLTGHLSKIGYSGAERLFGTVKRRSADVKVTFGRESSDSLVVSRWISASLSGLRMCISSGGLRNEPPYRSVPPMLPIAARTGRRVNQLAGR